MSWKRFWRQPGSRTGLAVFALICLLVAFAPWIAPIQPDKMDFAHSLEGPTQRHIMGTDQYGRDIFSRIAHGGRISLFAGLAAVLLGGVVGSVIGLISGYAGGAVDDVVMRVVDLLLTFPGLLLALMVMAVLGPGLTQTVTAVGVTFIAIFARVVRSTTLRIRRLAFVEAADALGHSWFRVLARHVLPNALPAALSTAAITFSWAVLSVSSLSFIGLGVKPPNPEWGAMLSEARSYAASAWWAAVFPGVFITLLVVSVNLIAEGLEEGQSREAA